MNRRKEKAKSILEQEKSGKLTHEQAKGINKARRENAGER